MSEGKWKQDAETEGAIRFIEENHPAPKETWRGEWVSKSLVSQLQSEAYEKGNADGQHLVIQTNAKRIEEARAEVLRECRIELERTMGLCVEDGTRIYSLIAKWKKREPTPSSPSPDEKKQVK